MSHQRNLARLARSGAPTVATAQAVRDMPIYGGLYPETVITRGAVTPGDGGGGTWYWDATTTDDDNTGTTLLLTGYVGPGRYRRFVDGHAWYANWFLDGSGDLATVVQAAVDALPDTGGTVILPAGRSKWRTSVKVCKSSVRIVGATVGGIPSIGASVDEDRLGSWVELDADLGIEAMIEFTARSGRASDGSIDYVMGCGIENIGFCNIDVSVIPNLKRHNTARAAVLVDGSYQFTGRRLRFYDIAGSAIAVGCTIKSHFEDVEMLRVGTDAYPPLHGWMTAKVNNTAPQGTTFRSFRMEVCVGIYAVKFEAAADGCVLDDFTFENQSASGLSLTLNNIWIESTLGDWTITNIHGRSNETDRTDVDVAEYYFKGNQFRISNISGGRFTTDRPVLHCHGAQHVTISNLNAGKSFRGVSAGDPSANPANSVVLKLTSSLRVSASNIISGGGRPVLYSSSDYVSVSGMHAILGRNTPAIHLTTAAQNNSVNDVTLTLGNNSDTTSLTAPVVLIESDYSSISNISFDTNKPYSFSDYLVKIQGQENRFSEFSVNLFECSGDLFLIDIGSNAVILEKGIFSNPRIDKKVTIGTGAVPPRVILSELIFYQSPTATDYPIYFKGSGAGKASLSHWASIITGCSHYAPSASVHLAVYMEESSSSGYSHQRVLISNCDFTGGVWVPNTDNLNLIGVDNIGPGNLWT